MIGELPLTRYKGLLDRQNVRILRRLLRTKSTTGSKVIIRMHAGRISPSPDLSERYHRRSSAPVQAAACRSGCFKMVVARPARTFSSGPSGPAHPGPTVRRRRPLTSGILFSGSLKDFGIHALSSNAQTDDFAPLSALSLLFLNLTREDPQLPPRPARGPRSA